MASDASETHELRSGDGCDHDPAEENVVSRHALQSTWENIYSAELRSAQERILYKCVPDSYTPICNSYGSEDTFRMNELNMALRCDLAVRNEVTDSESSSDISESLDGEEWFSQEAPRIVKWVSDILRVSHNHPLMPYFRSCHSQSDTRECTRAGVDSCILSSKFPVACRGNSCAWCKGAGTTLREDALWLPLLDVGCGNGIFLARLLRRGFKRLFGIDYSTNAIKMATLNLERECHIGSDKRRVDCAHVCLRVADLRDLKPAGGISLKPSCICHLCSRCKSIADANESDSGGTEEQISSRNERLNKKYGISSRCCTCVPLRDLPEFPVVLDKGTFDVFYLMGNTRLYAEQMSRLVPQHGLLFLTSCNCTEDELRRIFCVPLVTQRDEGYAKNRSRVGFDEGDESLSSKKKTVNESNTFEVLDSLPHRSFEFGGVKGQVVTSLLFRRL